jgi:hypothetical protein
MSTKVSKKLNIVNRLIKKYNNKNLLDDDPFTPSRLIILTDKKCDIAASYIFYHSIQVITNCNDIIIEEGNAEES